MVFECILNHSSNNKCAAIYSYICNACKAGGGKKYGADDSCGGWDYFFVSSSKVTGPLFINVTSIMAWNLPVATVICFARISWMNCS